MTRSVRLRLLVFALVWLVLPMVMQSPDRD